MDARIAEEQARGRIAADLLAREFPELAGHAGHNARHRTLITGGRLLHDASERAGRPLDPRLPDDLEHVRAVAREISDASRRANRGNLHARVLDF